MWVRVGVWGGVNVDVSVYTIGEMDAYLAFLPKIRFTTCF